MSKPVAVLGIDLGKNSCSVAGLDASGAAVLRKRFRREEAIAFASGLPPCVVAMEACCGAHHAARQLAARGHEVRLMPPEYVRPHVKAQKNDDRDAEGIAEAATRPTMRFAAAKTEAQLDMQSLHRVRDRPVGARTALVNQVRGLLMERGTTVPQGRRKLEAALGQLLDEAPDGAGTLSPRLRALLTDMREEWVGLDRRVAALDAEFAACARTDPVARRLASVPGVGPLNTTALAAALGDGAPAFRRARDLAAWMGLVPRQATTGGKPKLLGISKRGNGYLRRQLIHGARAVLPKVAAVEAPLGAWLRGLLARVHKNVAVVALAGKLARVAWAVLSTGRDFSWSPEAAAAAAAA